MGYNATVEVFTGDVAYLKGTGENLIQSMDYTPSVVTPVGKVVVIGNCPCIANENGPVGGGMEANVLGSIRIRGGIYTCKVDGAIPVRTKVYWDNTAKKVSLTQVGNTHFGYSCQTASTANNQFIPIEHNPDASPDAHRATSTVAAAGSTQADAAALNPGFNLVTGADATKGTLLPPTPADGTTVIVKNSDAANAVLKVYPAGAGIINALSASAAISMAAKTSATFTYLLSTTTWYTTPLVPS